MAQPSDVQSALPRLIVVKPEAWRGREYLLSNERSVIGRNTDSDIRLDDPGISRTHAMVVRRHDGEILLCDLHSSNGTLVNGMRIDTNGQTLRVGDLIRFADIELRFEPPGLQATALVPVVSTDSAGSQAAYRIGDQNASQISNVARDQHNAYYQQIQQERDSFLRDIASTKTNARRLILLGFLMYVVGGGIYTWVILRFATQINTSINDSSSPPSPSLLGPNIGNIPVGVIGFAILAIGSVLIIVGVVLHIVAASRRKRLSNSVPPPWQPAAPFGGYSP